MDLGPPGPAVHVGPFRATVASRSLVLTATASPVVEDGVLLGGVVVVRDVTEEERMRSRLERSRRAEGLGRLVASVAHELNNPLAGALACLEHLDAIEDDEVVDDLRLSVDRIRDIVRAMGQLAGGTGRPAVVDLGAALAGAVRVSGAFVRSRAVLEVEVVDPAPSVEIVIEELGSVLVDLLLNAGQACQPEGGRVSVQVRRDGDDAVIVVADNGCGIEPDVLPRIFDPFFSTRDVNEGTGLGLSIAHRVVTSHGGSMIVDSEAGVGTEVTVRLPAVRPHRRGTLDAGVATGLDILVIDDDSLVRNGVARILRRSNRVVTAETLEECRRAVEEVSFDIVLCDVMMSPHSGVDILGSLTELQPRLADGWIFISGGVFDPEHRAGIDASGVPLMRKPFTASQLNQMIRQRTA